MLRAPSRRKRKEPMQKLNLIPILDAVFIFIFFLLMSANFIKIFEIPSDVPIVSEATPPNDKKPLALTLKITSSGILVYQGVPSTLIKRINKTTGGEYDYESLRSYAIGLKQRYTHEKSMILEPITDISYEEIVKIMDSIRSLRKTDPAIFIKKDGVEVRTYQMFDQIVFGNIQS